MSTKNVTFSIIMPCYNSEAYVRNALDSIVGQTYPHWELVAVNDGSFDSTLDILNEYAQNEPRIRIYSKENGGYCSAVNMGLDHVTGDYFLMLGSDDRLATDLFEQLTNHIEDELPDILIFRTINQANNKIWSFTDFDTPCTAYNTTLATFSDTYTDHTKALFCRDTSRCFKREHLCDLRYFGKYGICGDSVFSMLFCHNATSFACLPINGYLWAPSTNSVSANKNKIKYLDMISVLHRFYQELLQHPAHEIAETEKTFVKSYYTFINYICTNPVLTLKKYFFIRKHLKFIKTLIEEFNINTIELNHYTFLSMFPFTYSIFYILKHLQ